MKPLLLMYGSWPAWRIIRRVRWEALLLGFHTRKHTGDELVREGIHGRMKCGDELVVIKPLDDLVQLLTVTSRQQRTKCQL